MPRGRKALAAYLPTPIPPKLDGPVNRYYLELPGVPDLCNTCAAARGIDRSDIRQALGSLRPCADCGKQAIDWQTGKPAVMVPLRHWRT